MKYKAVVIDLDGTLLDSAQTISTRSEQAIRRLSEAGYIIIIATGRPPHMVDEYYPQLDVADFKVYFNGALIKHKGALFGRKHPLAPASVEETQDFFAKYGDASLLLYETETEMLTNRILTEEESQLLTHGDKPFVQPKIVTDQEVRSLDVYKILFDRHSPAQGAYQQRFAHKLSIGYMLGGNPIEVTHPNSDKQHALIQIFDYLSLDVSEVVVFGDEYNDVGMFELCGHPVAMGNATDEVKACAKTITGTNDQDGVAEILERLLGTGEVKNG